MEKFACYTYSEFKVVSFDESVLKDAIDVLNIELKRKEIEKLVNERVEKFYKDLEVLYLTILKGCDDTELSFFQRCTYGTSSNDVKKQLSPQTTVGVAHLLDYGGS